MVAGVSNDGTPLKRQWIPSGCRRLPVYMPRLQPHGGRGGRVTMAAAQGHLSAWRGVVVVRGHQSAYDRCAGLGLTLTLNLL